MALILRYVDDRIEADFWGPPCTRWPMRVWASLAVQEVGRRQR